MEAKVKKQLVLQAVDCGTVSAGVELIGYLLQQVYR